MRQSAQGSSNTIDFACTEDLVHITCRSGGPRAVGVGGVGLTLSERRAGVGSLGRTVGSNFWVATLPPSMTMCVWRCCAQYVCILRCLSGEAELYHGLCRMCTCAMSHDPCL